MDDGARMLWKDLEARMNHSDNAADDRLMDGCLYCGGPLETREHVPSRVLLDSPFPENLPVVGACRMCNNAFSLDEEYLACLIDCVLAGTTNPDLIPREKTAKALRRNPALRARIEAQKVLVGSNTQFGVEQERVESVVLKIARSHVAYDLGQVRREGPTSLLCVPLEGMPPEKREAFEAAHVVQSWGEIGSRAFQRSVVVNAALRSSTGDTRELGLLVCDWVDVQGGRYRYLAVDDSEGILIRFVIAEYLACEVFWAAED